MKVDVMTNYGCQLDYIWNKLKHKLLGTYCEEFPDELFESGRTVLNMGGTFWGGPDEDMREGNFALYLLVLALAGLSFCCF